MIQLSDSRVESLSETREQVERDDQESLVGLLNLRWVGAVVLEIDEGLLDDGDTTLEDGLRVVDEALSDRNDNGGETLGGRDGSDRNRGVTSRTAHLQQRDQIGVEIAQTAPPSDQWWHEDVDVSRVVERGSDGVGECSNGIVENEQVLLLILVERKDEVAENRAEERLELSSCLLLECCER